MGRAYPGVRSYPEVLFPPLCESLEPKRDEGQHDSCRLKSGETTATRSKLIGSSTRAHSSDTHGLSVYDSKVFLYTPQQMTAHSYYPPWPVLQVSSEEPNIPTTPTAFMISFRPRWFAIHRHFDLEPRHSCETGRYEPEAVH